LFFGLQLKVVVTEKFSSGFAVFLGMKKDSVFWLRYLVVVVKTFAFTDISQKILINQPLA